MHALAKIQPVPRRKHDDAMRFLVGGRRDDELTQIRFESLKYALSRRSDKVHLWWARHEEQTVAAALVVQGQGHSGMLFHCSVDADGVDVDALVDLLRQLSDFCLASGMSIVQSLVEVDLSADHQVLERAGFIRLAELIYMRRNLLAAMPLEPADDVTWRRWGNYSIQELSTVIEQTYEGSLDCPAISGKRRIEDIIQGHKASGIFTPQMWWLIEFAGEPAGCCLINDTGSQHAAELVYIGIVPKFRGKGLARLIICHAAAELQGRGYRSLILAVDSSNGVAKRIYDQTGFVETDRRLAYMRWPEN